MEKVSISFDIDDVKKIITALDSHLFEYGYTSEEYKYGDKESDSAKLFKIMKELNSEIGTSKIENLSVDSFWIISGNPTFICMRS